MRLKFKKFVSYYKPYSGLFFSVLLCAFIAAGISLLYPLLTRYITKTVLQGNMDDALHQIIMTAMAMLGLIVFQTVCNYYVDYRAMSWVP
jgi:ATP-binding cassette subfamily B protein